MAKVVGGETFLTAGEAATIMRLRSSTIYELARRRKLPFVKFGRAIRFPHSMIVRWCFNQVVPPDVDPPEVDLGDPQPTGSVA